MALIEKTFNNFKEEAELFFVTEFLTNEDEETGIDKIKDDYKFCLDVMFNLTKEIDFAKGLIISSTQYGQGKSLFFDVIHHRVKRTKNQNIFRRTNSEELCSIFVNTKKGVDPKKELIKFISVRNLYIDDIGDELKDGDFRSNYKNKLNVLRFVILERYRMWLEKGFKLYGTMNLTQEAIIKHYGGRVSDRITQMCYNRDFTFINGSFRQVSSVRKLSQEEIRQNWLKVQKKEEIENIDLDAYFNEIITNESEDELQNKGQYFWDFCLDFLKKKELLNDDDFNKIDDKSKEWARTYIYGDIRKSLGMILRNAPVGVYNKRLKEAKSKIGDIEVQKKCETIIAKNKFIELKKQKHRFK